MAYVFVRISYPIHYSDREGDQPFLRRLESGFCIGFAVFFAHAREKFISTPGRPPRGQETRSRNAETICSSSERASATDGRGKFAVVGCKWRARPFPGGGSAWRVGQEGDHQRVTSSMTQLTDAGTESPKYNMLL